MKLGIFIGRVSALACTVAAILILMSPTRAQTNATIRVSALSIESAAEIYYAKDMGYFTKAGLDVDIQSLPGGSAAIGAAIAAGTLDIGYSAIDTLASMHAKGIPVIVIAPANEYLAPGSVHTTAMVVPVTSTVQNAKDLNGKTVAVGALNSVAEIAPEVWIDKNGGDSSTVKFVEVPFGAMPAAIQAARVDAAWIAEPFIGVATRNGRAVGYGFDGISKHFLVSSWFTTPQWAKDHPDLVKRFAAVMHETAVWANTNPPKSGEILAKYTKIDPTVISTMARSHFGEQLSPTLTQPLIDVAAKYDRFSTFPAQELLYGP